jgi:hypothetical protein
VALAGRASRPLPPGILALGAPGAPLERPDRWR